MLENLPIIITDDTSETEELGAFLEKVSCAALFVYIWPEAILRERAHISIDTDPFVHSPYFGKYIEEILDRIDLCVKGKVGLDFVYPGENDIKLELSKPSTIDTLQEAIRIRMRGQGWDLPAVWQWVGTGLAFGCAAGGSKALLDLLKLWVEERKGRKIKIKKGDIELEISGGVSAAEIQKILELFEEKFGKSKIIQP